MGGSSPKSDHRCSAYTVALPGALAEKPFPDTLVSAKIRPGVGLTVADDQSAGRGAVPGAPGRTRGAWGSATQVILAGKRCFVTI
jgi:hypothetical protein